SHPVAQTEFFENRSREKNMRFSAVHENQIRQRPEVAFRMRKAPPQNFAHGGVIVLTLGRLDSKKAVSRAVRPPVAKNSHRSAPVVLSEIGDIEGLYSFWRAVKRQPGPELR